MARRRGHEARGLIPVPNARSPRHRTRGLYSYDWLDNLANLDVHSAEEIVPELQDLEVGDLVRLAPESMGAEAGGASP